MSQGSTSSLLPGGLPPLQSCFPSVGAATPLVCSVLRSEKHDGVPPRVVPTGRGPHWPCREGMLWLPDLATPDPYYILPIVLAAADMTNIEVRCYVTCYCCNSGTIAPLHVYTPGVLLFCFLPVCKLSK